MNKPIRTISMFCMLLFIALMANATYLQYWQADALNKDARNRRIIQEAFSRERGPILVAGDTVALSEESSDEYKFQRTYPHAVPLRTRHRLVLLLLPDRHRAEPERRAVGRRLAAVRDPPGRPGQRQQHQGRPGLADPRPRCADRCLRRAARARPRRAGRRGRHRAGDRQDPGDVSLPTYDPNLLASHDFAAVSENYDRLNEDPTKPLLNRGIQTTLPPGSTFKLVTAAAAIESGN